MQTYLIFPGQGCQKPGMAKDFYDADASVREMFSAASEHCKIDFCDVVFNGTNLDESRFTQPAILLASLAALSYVSARCDLRAVGYLGHSLGEFSACCAAGMMQSSQAAALVHARGQFMQECASSDNPAGMMVALGLKDADVEYIVDALQKNQRQIWAANYNCDGQIVLAGLRADLEHAAGLLKDAGAKRAMLLNMSVASHCPLMQPAAKRLEPLLESALEREALAPIYANATAEEYRHVAAAKEALLKQLCSPVLYKQSIIKICQERAEPRFIEFGASVLSGLNKKITTAPTHSVASIAAANELIEKLAGEAE